MSAEREAWRIHDEQHRWSMVAVNPGLVLGPALTAASVSGSLFLLDELMGGKLFFGVPDISFAPVDVRDVAQAHIAAATNDSASGRYLVSRPDMVSFIEMTRTIREVHQRPILLPHTTIPKFVLKAIGPMFKLDRQFVDAHVGVRFRLDNSRIIEELGQTYRPVEESLHDHYRAWASAQHAA